MLLRELLEAPDLRLRVLVGEDALDRPVGGVFTTDLLDPRRYLSGGEIVLTGLMWRRARRTPTAFVSAVVAAGAVALAAGDAALGSVPGDLVLACRQHRLPLFEVPVDVSFAAITEQVLTARLRLAGPAGPGPAVARLRSVAAAPPGGPTGARRARRGQPVGRVRRGGQRIRQSPGGCCPRPGGSSPGRRPRRGAALRRALAGAWLGAGDRPVTVLAGGAPYSLWPLAGQSAHRLAGWFVALAGDQAGWDDGQAGGRGRAGGAGGRAPGPPRGGPAGRAPVGRRRAAPGAGLAGRDRRGRGDRRRAAALRPGPVSPARRGRADRRARAARRGAGAGPDRAAAGGPRTAGGAAARAGRRGVRRGGGRARPRGAEDGWPGSGTRWTGWPACPGSSWRSG